MSATQQSSSPSELRYQATRRVTLVGALVNTLLACAQLVVGWLGQSQALIADGIHTLSDLASDALVLIAARISAQDADEDHPYGHGRFETLGTVGLAILLALVGLEIAWNAGERLFNPDELLQPQPIALIAAAFGVLAKEGLYRYTVHVARGIQSRLLEANAWHHRSDALSSIVVFIGIGGTLLGLPYLDAIAAVGVGLMILKMAWELAYPSLKELADTGVDAEKLEEMRGHILAVPGVEDLHVLRTRQMGAEVLVDVHIVVQPLMSVSEGHYIAEQVKRHLQSQVEDVADVLVHIDPEDDEEGAPSVDLPARPELEEQLRQIWQGSPLLDVMSELRLHYVSGRVDVDVLLPINMLENPDGAEMVRDLTAQARDSIDTLGEIHIYYQY